MAQLGWVYLDPQGGQHRVGLYHGDKTGHLVIHCNMRVIQIDFAVKESKSYSFFIEDELCEVNIYKEHGFYSYAFTTNKDVDTPLNRLRKTENRRNLKQVFWFAGGLAILIGLSVFGLKSYDNWQKSRRFMEDSLLSAEAFTSQGKLANQGKTAVAQLYYTREGKRNMVYYAFTTADSLRSFGQFEVPEEGVFILPTGFPLADSDAFQVTYLPDKPQAHRVEFNVPTRPTITRYLQLAQAMEQQNHPDVSTEKTRCTVLTAAAKRDWQVLGHFIFQGKTPQENTRYNRDTYLKVMRDPDLEAALQAECWDK